MCEGFKCMSMALAAWVERKKLVIRAKQLWICNYEYPGTHKFINQHSTQKLLFYYIY